MANKRGGLSKKEFARATAAKAAPKKSSSKSTASKSIAPLVGAGPLLPGQKRVGGTVTGAGPLLPNQTRAVASSSSKSSSSSSSKSSSKKPTSTYRPDLTSSEAPKSNRGIAASFIKPGFSGPISSPYGKISGAANDRSTETKLGRGLRFANESAGALFGKDRLLDKDYNVTEFFNFNDKLRTPTADDVKSIFGNTAQAAEYAADPNEYYRDVMQNKNTSPLGNPQYGDIYDDIARDTDNQSPTQSFSPAQNFSPAGPKKPRSFSSSDGSDFDPNENPRKSYFENELTPEVGPADTPIVDAPFGTQRPASGRGSGLFGTGKGVGNPAGPEDEYITSLRKSLKGYGSQENDVMRQFKSLIKALDPTYDEYEREGKEELDKALWNNNTQLASVMNANNTGDSEQRAQLMAGQQRDNQNQLGDLLRKLALQKNEDIQGYKTKGVEAVNKIRGDKQTAQQKVAELIQSYKQQQWDNDYKMKGLGTKGSSKDPYAKSDAAFEKDAQTLAGAVRGGKMSREAAANQIRVMHPDYDENIIYDLLPDNMF